MISTVRIRQKGLATRGDPLDRVAKLDRYPGHNHLFGIVEDLAAKSTAHVGRDDAQLVFRDKERSRAQ